MPHTKSETVDNQIQQEFVANYNQQTMASYQGFEQLVPACQIARFCFKGCKKEGIGCVIQMLAYDKPMWKFKEFHRQKMSEKAKPIIKRFFFVTAQSTESFTQ